MLFCDQSLCFMKIFQTFSIIKPHEKEKREKQSGDGVRGAGSGGWGKERGLK